MAFYDDWNFDGLKFFSKIKSQPDSGITEPCKEFISVIQQLKYHLTPPRNVTVAEIGIGFGATALQVLQTLDADDVYYAFDFENTLKIFADDLQARDFGIKCEIVLAGNSYDHWDSYNWALSNMVFRMRELNEAGVFDAVYLDGAHTLLHDGLAVCLLKELIKKDGFLVLDDLFWKFSCCTWGLNYAPGRLPRHQMDDCQILRVQELFLSNDPNWEKLSKPEDWRGIFRKRSR